MALSFLEEEIYEREDITFKSGCIVFHVCDDARKFIWYITGVKKFISYHSGSEK